MRPAYILLKILLIFLLTQAGALHAQPLPNISTPVLLEADDMAYDNKAQIVVALGNVEVVQGDYVVFADKLTYFQTQNIVEAQGNVSVMEPSGNIYFANTVRLKDDLKAGVVEQFSARLQDNSLFAAARATQVNENITQMEKAIYTACKLCEETSPFWQLRADTIVNDEADQTITYRDVWLDFFGFPVAYTPYFSHPSPNADRKSGFLTPEYSQSSNLGTSIKLPYYINLDPSYDLTLTPRILSEESSVLQVDYRQLFSRGDFQFSGSITNPRRLDDFGERVTGREVRGHVFSKANIALDDTWQAGFDINRSTDDTYLRRYDYGNQDSLTSRIFATGLHGGRNFSSAELIVFQGLRAEDDPDTTPVILPLIEGYYETEPIENAGNARLFATANARSVARDEGSDNQRLSTTVGTKIPYVTKGGHIFEATAQVRNDIVRFQDVIDENGVALNDDTDIRTIPQFALHWRYPLIKQFSSSHLTIEPTILAVASPGGNNPSGIVNEEDLVTEFSDLNIFSLNPFPGYDLVNEGSRLVYGVNAALNFESGQNIAFMIGQNINAEDSSPFPFNENGEPDNFSHYIGRVLIDYHPVSASYFFRLDEENFSPFRHEAYLAYNGQRVNASIDYLFLRDDPFISDLQEVGANGNYRFLDNWSLSVFGRRDLTGQAGTILAGSGLTYFNDCFSITTQVKRDFTRDRDVEPDDSVSVRVNFKNLN